MSAKDKFFDITFNQDGTFEVDSTGFKGKSCEEEINKLIKNVGQVIASKKKNEYYQEEKVKIHGHVG